MPPASQLRLTASRIYWQRSAGDSFSFGAQHNSHRLGRQPLAIDSHDLLVTGDTFIAANALRNPAVNAVQPQTPNKPAVTFKERSFGMDLLRSAAIWTVMLAHISYWFNPAEDGIYSTFIMPLMRGVEPFFVLGGFLAAITFLKMRHQGQERFTFNDVKGYWYRRWARTLPNYFLFLNIYTLAFSFAKPDFSFMPTILSSPKIFSGWHQIFSPCPGRSLLRSGFIYFSH